MNGNYLFFYFCKGVLFIFVEEKILVKKYFVFNMVFLYIELFIGRFM